MKTKEDYLTSVDSLDKPSRFKIITDLIGRFDRATSLYPSRPAAQVWILCKYSAAFAFGFWLILPAEIKTLRVAVIAGYVLAFHVLLGKWVFQRRPGTGKVQARAGRILLSFRGSYNHAKMMAFLAKAAAIYTRQPCDELVIDVSTMRGSLTVGDKYAITRYISSHIPACCEILFVLPQPQHALEPVEYALAHHGFWVQEIINRRAAVRQE